MNQTGRSLVSFFSLSRQLYQIMTKKSQCLITMLTSLASGIRGSQGWLKFNTWLPSLTQ